MTCYRCRLTYKGASERLLKDHTDALNVLGDAVRYEITDKTGGDLTLFVDSESLAVIDGVCKMLESDVLLNMMAHGNENITEFRAQKPK